MPVPEGYIGFVEEIPGANSQGETLDEVRENLREAVQLVLEANRELAEQALIGQKSSASLLNWLPDEAGRSDSSHRSQRLWLPSGGRQAHGLRQSDRTKSIHGSAAPRDQRIHGKENLP